MDASPVNKVAVAVKHPGVFMQTSELEDESGQKLPLGENEFDVEKEQTVDHPPEDIKVESPTVEAEIKADVVEKSPAKSRSRRRRASRSRKRKGSTKKNTEAKKIVKAEDENDDETEDKADDIKNVAEDGNKNEDDCDDEKRPTTDVNPENGGEVEMIQDIVEVKSEDVNDIADNTEPEEQDPQPTAVVTRRSNRRLQQQLRAEQKLREDSEEEMPVDDVENDGNAEVHDDDRFDVDSIASEMDTASIASGSTLTTRSSSRRGTSKTEADSTTNSKKMSRQRSRSNKSSSNKAPLASNTKGRSRRIIFKKSATKAPSAVARAVTSDRVFYKGQYFTRGDIVSVVDVDGDVFYAQLRGFLTDQYCEKSGVITWLLPTANSPRPSDGFDASTYVIGPEEELPRKLEYFTFVMHAPDNYFYHKSAPYPTTAVDTDQEYVITRTGPKVRLVKADNKTVFHDIPAV